MIQNQTMTSDEFKVLQNFVLVKPVPLETGEVKTESGLVLDTSQNTSVVDRSTTGTILNCGPKCEFVEAGQEILWPRTDGQDIQLKDGEFILLKETSVLGYRA